MAHTNPCTPSKVDISEFRPLWAACTAHRGREQRSGQELVCAHWAKPGGTTESQMHQPDARPWCPGSSLTHSRGSRNPGLAIPRSARVEMVGCRACEPESGGGACAVTRRAAEPSSLECAPARLGLRARGAGHVGAEPAQWRRPLSTSRAYSADLHKMLGRRRPGPW